MFLPSKLFDVLFDIAQTILGSGLTIGLVLIWSIFSLVYQSEAICVLSLLSYLLGGSCNIRAQGLIRRGCRETTQECYQCHPAGFFYLKLSYLR